MVASTATEILQLEYHDSTAQITTTSTERQIFPNHMRALRRLGTMRNKSRKGLMCKAEDRWLVETTGCKRGGNLGEFEDSSICYAAELVDKKE